MNVFELLGLRGTQKILGELDEKGAVRYSELVHVVGFSTTTTRALKRMEQLGWWKRMFWLNLTDLLRTLSQKKVKSLPRS